MDKGLHDFSRHIKNCQGCVLLRIKKIKDDDEGVVVKGETLKVYKGKSGRYTHFKFRMRWRTSSDAFAVGAKMIVFLADKERGPDVGPCFFEIVKWNNFDCIETSQNPAFFSDKLKPIEGVIGEKFNGNVYSFDDFEQLLFEVVGTN